MVGFVSSLLEKGLSDDDIRILVYANFDFEKFQKIVKSLDYWCHEWKDKRFPTPLKIVYCYENLRMVALPFLDTSISQDKLWGIAVGNLIIHKKAIPQVAIYEASGLLRKCAYETYHSWPGEGNPQYGVRLPTSKDMRQIIKNYRDIFGTIGFLHRYGIEFDDFSCDDYWTQELEEPYSMGIGVVEADHVLVRQQAAETKSCMVRPVLSLFEEDKDEGLDFIGSLDENCLPDKKSEKFAKKLR